MSTPLSSAEQAAIVAQVAKGATLLDERQPGWERRINLAHLDVAYPRACVLGQLYPSFAKGAVTLFGDEAYVINAPVLIEHGFSGRACTLFEMEEPFEEFEEYVGPECTHDRDENCPEYAALTDEWARAIIRRQEEGAK